MNEMKPCVLTGKFIQLESLDEGHKKELEQIAQNEIIWTYGASRAMGKDFESRFKKAISLFSGQQHFPFVARCLDDVV